MSLCAAAAPSPATRAGADLDPCEQRAADDAFAELTARLLQLRLNERQTVREWIGDRVRYDVALRRAAYDGRIVEKRSSDGGELCQVGLSIVLDTTVRGWALRLRAETDVSVAELEELRRWSLQLGPRRLTAVGVADPRATPTGAAPPVGWSHLPPEATELTSRAAMLDAADRLLDECRLFRLSPTEPLSSVFDLYPDFEDALRRHFEQTATARSRPTFEPFEVCRVAVQITRAEIVAALAQVSAELPADRRPPAIDFTQLTDPRRREVVAVEGVSSPPPSRLAWPGRTVAGNAPAWATERLTAVGRGGRSGGASALADVDAAREAALIEARNDAVRNMWSQVDELVLPDRRRVRELILGNPSLASELASLEERMRAAGQVEYDADGRATVKITMPLAPLWDVLKRAWPAGGGAAAPATRPST